VAEEDQFELDGPMVISLIATPEHPEAPPAVELPDDHQGLINQSITLAIASTVHEGDPLVDEGAVAQRAIELYLRNEHALDILRSRSGGASLIVAERNQVLARTGGVEHDDQHTQGELVAAAICYAADPLTMGVADDLWPWAQEEWKPTPDNRIRELTKAGQFLAAEIDRLHRLRMKELADFVLEQHRNLQESVAVPEISRGVNRETQARSGGVESE
jgi:hypothetical protein